jgi:hypothetical protein
MLASLHCWHSGMIWQVILCNHQLRANPLAVYVIGWSNILSELKIAGLGFHCVQAASFRKLCFLKKLVICLLHCTLCFFCHLLLYSYVRNTYNSSRVHLYMHREYNISLPNLFLTSKMIILLMYF